MRRDALYNKLNSGAAILKGTPLTQPDYVATVLARHNAWDDQNVRRGLIPMETSIDRYLSDKHYGSTELFRSQAFKGIIRGLQSSPNAIAQACARTDNASFIPDWVPASCRRPLTPEDFKYESAARINSGISSFKSMFNPPEMRTDASAATSSGASFLSRQLVGVSPIVNVTQIRGLAYGVLPIISQNAGQKSFERNVYSTQGEFELISEGKTTNRAKLEGISKTDTVPMFNYGVTLQFSIEELIAMQYGEMARGATNGFVAPFVELPMKMIALQQQYQQIVDDIYMLGDKIEVVKNLSGGAEPRFSPFLNGGVAKGLEQAVVDSSLSSVHFNTLDKGQLYKLLNEVVISVPNQSGSRYVADTLLIDLKSFNHAMGIQGGQAGASDSNALRSYVDTGSVKAIIPVAAWSEAFPDKTSMVALQNNVGVLYGNQALSLTYGGMDFRDDVLGINYFFKTAGMCFDQGLGLVQYQQGFGS